MRSKPIAKAANNESNIRDNPSIDKSCRYQSFNAEAIGKQFLVALFGVNALDSPVLDFAMWMDIFYTHPQIPDPRISRLNRLAEAMVDDIRGLLRYLLIKPVADANSELVTHYKIASEQYLNPPESGQKELNYFSRLCTEDELRRTVTTREFVVMLNNFADLGPRAAGRVLREFAKAMELVVKRSSTLKQKVAVTLLEVKRAQGILRDSLSVSDCPSTYEILVRIHRPNFPERDTGEKFRRGEMRTVNRLAGILGVRLRPDRTGKHSKLF